MKTLACVAVVGGLLLLSGGLMAQEENPRETRECTFTADNPVILKVGDCESLGRGLKSILVVTNTRTIVSLRYTDFIRFERDCDGETLETWDVIEARALAVFVETPHCEDGAPLEVKELDDNLWCVNPHRGGYRMLLALFLDDNAEICDDAGCYQAKATVTIAAQPFESCRDIDEDCDN